MYNINKQDTVSSPNLQGQLIKLLHFWSIVILW